VVPLKCRNMMNVKPYDDCPMSQSSRLLAVAADFRVRQKKEVRSDCDLDVWNCKYLGTQSDNEGGMT